VQSEYELVDTATGEVWQSARRELGTEDLVLEWRKLADKVPD
jgi:hypothetical protein